MGRASPRTDGFYKIGCVCLFVCDYVRLCIVYVCPHIVCVAVHCVCVCERVYVVSLGGGMLERCFISEEQKLLFVPAPVLGSWGV